MPYALEQCFKAQVLTLKITKTKAGNETCMLGQKVQT